MIKSCKGISLITLIITIIIMIILCGITIYSSNIVEKANFQKIHTNMQLISTKVNIINEKVTFEGEQSKSKYYVGLRLKDLPNKEEIAKGTLTQEELQDKNYYVYNQPTLDSIGLEGIKLKNGEVYIVNYNTKDIIYPNGCKEPNGETIYNLSEIYGSSEEDTSKNPHRNGDGDIGCEHEFTIEATCITATKCSKCGAEQGSPLGHTPSEAATCTTAQICTTCNTTIELALGHTPSEAATCTTAQTCIRCDAVVTAALGHTGQTHANGGKCTRCQTVYVTHSWGAYSTTKAATCTATGTKTRTCTASGCTQTDSASIAALGHNYVYDNTKSPSEPSHVTKCTRCNGYSTASHTLGAAPTCTTAQQCTICRYTVQSALGHNYSSKITKAATCTAAGTKTFTCTRCSSSYTNSLPALGHNWVTAGSGRPRCSRCSAQM